MYDHLLESSRWDDSNKWSNIGFGQEIDVLEMKIRTLSGALDMFNDRRKLVLTIHILSSSETSIIIWLKSTYTYFAPFRLIPSIDFVFELDTRVTEASDSISPSIFKTILFPEVKTYLHKSLLNEDETYRRR